MGVFVRALNQCRGERVSMSRRLTIPIVSITGFPFIRLGQCHVSRSFLVFPRVDDFVVPYVRAIVRSAFLDRAYLSRGYGDLRVSCRRSYRSSIRPLSSPNRGLPKRLASRGVQGERVRLRSSTCAIVRTSLRNVDIRVRSVCPLSFVWHRYDKFFFAKGVGQGVFLL